MLSKVFVHLGKLDKDSQTFESERSAVEAMAFGGKRVALKSKGTNNALWF